MSRLEAVGAVLFIGAAAVIVATTAELRFGRPFAIALAVAVVLLVLTRHKLAYVAAALAWIAFRFVLASVFQRNPKWLAHALMFGAAAWGVLLIGLRREERDFMRRRW